MSQHWASGHVHTDNTRGLTTLVFAFTLILYSVNVSPSII